MNPSPFLLDEMRARIDPNSPANKMLAKMMADNPPKPLTPKQKLEAKLREMKRRIANAEAALRGEWEPEE